ncbi:MAG: hypothetical protein AB1512_13290 [Thermodesulfobacteriota bacterium]
MDQKRHTIKTVPVAYFVSPHGYGHAARAAAVMESLTRAASGKAEFHIYTKVPRWFFRDSVSGPFHYHPVLTDIGLVQQTPLQADLQETVNRLDRFLPVDVNKVEALARQIVRAGCRMVVCDIAPLGIQVARTAGIPSVLVENFTWDWLYGPYERLAPRMAPHIRYLKGLFRASDFHIQTEPVCRRQPVDLVTRPVSRKARMPAGEVRRRLDLPERASVVLITMGGIASVLPFLERLREVKGVRFLIPGGAKTIKHQGNLVLLPHHSQYFHPDLLAASDAVVGKVGYSTLAETYWAGIPFGFIARRSFRESGKLVSFIREHLAGLAIREEGFHAGTWISRLPELLSLPRIRRHDPNGADEVARFLIGLF